MSSSPTRTDTMTASGARRCTRRAARHRARSPGRRKLGTITHARIELQYGVESCRRTSCLLVAHAIQRLSHQGGRCPTRPLWSF